MREFFERRFGETIDLGPCVVGRNLNLVTIRGYGRLDVLAAVSAPDVFDQKLNPTGTQRALKPKHARDCFETLRDKQDRDGWWLAFKQAMTNLLGEDVAAALDVSLIEVEDKTVAVVMADRGETETWLVDGDSYEFYIRNGPSTVQLIPPDAVEYIRSHFPVK